MKILIPNGSSPRNLGDQAILHGLIDYVYTRFPDAEITVHLNDRELLTHPAVQTTRPNLYSWAVFEKRQFITRIWRLCLLIIAYCFAKLGALLSSMPEDLRTIIEDYRTADVIVFNGGGYLRSNPGLTQVLNVLMILSMFKFGRLWKSNIVVAPISFGPFSQRWLEHYSAGVLASVKRVLVREDISLNRLRTHRLSNLQKSSDLAFLLDAGNGFGASDNNLIGFALRKWLPQQQQKQLEQEFMQALVRVQQHMPSVKFQPIVQVNAPDYGDIDFLVTQRVSKQLQAAGLTVLPAIVLEDLKHAWQVYARLGILVGMRMHSNILAALVGVPFVGISYEHKTEGIAKDLGLQDYVVHCSSLEAKNLSKIIIAAIQLRSQLSHTIQQNIVTIKAVVLGALNSIVVKQR